MAECIHNQNNAQKDFFYKTFFQLKDILHKEYFTPFDREDIYIIAVKLELLFRFISQYKLKADIVPITYQIKNIINMFNTSERKKYHNILNAIKQYNKLNKEELLLHDDSQKINKFIILCDDTVTQIEYTILKNS